MKAIHLKAKEFDIECNDKNLPFIIWLNEKRVLRRNKVMVNKGQILLHAVRQSFFFYDRGHRQTAYQYFRQTQSTDETAIWKKVIFVTVMYPQKSCESKKEQIIYLYSLLNNIHLNPWLLEGLSTSLSYAASLTYLIPNWT